MSLLTGAELNSLKAILDQLPELTQQLKDAQENLADTQLSKDLTQVGSDLRDTKTQLSTMEVENASELNESIVVMQQQLEALFLRVQSDNPGERDDIRNQLTALQDQVLTQQNLIGSMGV